MTVVKTTSLVHLHKNFTFWLGYESCLECYSVANFVAFISSWMESFLCTLVVIDVQKNCKIVNAYIIKVSDTTHKIGQYFQ